MIPIPYDCPRGRSDCIALAKIESAGGASFFCCGENNGDAPPVARDRYTVCFKGEDRDDMVFLEKMDLTHQTAVLAQAVAVIQAAAGEEQDWSPWRHYHGGEQPSSSGTGKK